jgi:hypothetical protein
MAMKTSQGLDRWLQPLASLRLAVVLLGLLAAVLAATTFYESSYGTEAAQRHVYQAVWFDLLLQLLGINVAAAAIIRWPWRLKQVGFVITHVAILAILGGCLTTHWLGVTGRVVLTEGQQDAKVIQDGWVIQAVGHGMGSRGSAVQIPIDQPPRVDKTIAFESGGQSYTLHILQYLDNAETQTLLVEGADKDPAAILVELKQAPHAGMADEMPPSQQWLLVDDKTQWAINTPGFSLVAASQYTPPTEPAAAGPAKGTLIATIDSRDYDIDVEKALAAPVPVADGKTETRKIFAKFGDISAMHGGAKEQAVKLSLRHSGATQGGMKVVLVPSQDKWVLHEDNGQKLLQEADMAPGAAVTLKGMPVALTIKTILSHAKPAKQVVAVPLPKGAEPQPALQVEVTGPKGQYRDWLAWGQPATFTMGPNALRLTLQSRQYPLPFAIKLDKFELETYAGSQMPAMYRSEVTVIDTQDREKRSVTIEMNQPLEYKGWSFFQSSYSTSGGHNVSILAASKDPGKPIVYIGAILLVLGTSILAFQRLKAQMPSSAKTAPAAQTDASKTVPVETKHE